MRYFLNDQTGGWMTLSGDAAVFNIVPDGYREVSAEEYHQAAGTIILDPPQGPPAEDEPADAQQAAAEPVKARSARGE